MNMNNNKYNINNLIQIMELINNSNKAQNKSPKKPLNLSLEENFIKAIKHIAVKRETTVSKLLEDYIKAIINTNEELIQLVEIINNN